MSEPYKPTIRDILLQETVYSKRFLPPQEEYRDVLADMSPDERAAAQIRIINGMISDNLKPSTPELLEKCERFIELAKSIAETHRIDADILRDKEGVDVHFFFPQDKRYFELSPMLAQLIRMSDDIAFRTCDSGVRMVLGFCLCPE